MQPRIVVSVDQTTEDALDYLAAHYGLTRSALVRLAVRRMAEAEGWEASQAPRRKVGEAEGQLAAALAS